MGSVVASLSGCSYFESEKLDDPNNATLASVTNNATKQQLDFLSTGVFSDMRTNGDGIVWHYQITGAIGREVYVLAGSDSRYVANLLGTNGSFDNNNFLSGRYFTTYSSARRTARTLAQAAQNANSVVTATQRKGYTALAKTAEAYSMLVLSDLQYENGLRVDVSDPQKPGKIQSYDVVLAAIKALLDDAATDLAAAGTAFPFVFPAGYNTPTAGVNFRDPAGFLKFNRALAARVAVRIASRPGASVAKYQDVLTALSGSFINDGSFTAGPRFNFSATALDAVNPLFQTFNNNGSVVVLAHPSFRRDIRVNDTRISKIAARTTALTPARQGFTSADDVAIYASNAAPVAIIKREELILLSAEANAKLGNIATAVMEVNSIATAYNAVRPVAQGGPLTPASTAAAVIEEILYQRRYSLFYEGQRWVDLRRLNMLDNLNVGGTGKPEVSTTGLQTTVVKQLPIPFAEIAWDQANPQ